jgi:hypothetical protein
MNTKEMDYAQGSYNHGHEIRELNINLGNEKIESNGHIRRVEPI